ncbi:uncharacterized protein LOC106671957 [Cimex lectularius]|uniref:C-type lectin domain-containing protein n=1 Tax=Cimex lectularius TaxID=79782 RepID=A0A8I6S3Y2_CIMLE|nr:uncharacterized protein LOC106671957 [Cimex lectularius]
MAQRTMTDCGFHANPATRFCPTRKTMPRRVKGIKSVLNGFAFYCQITFWVFIAGTSEGQDTCHVEDGRLPSSLTLNDMRYVLVLKKADFFTAMDYCRLIGMDLLWFRKEDEMKQFFSSLNKDVRGSLEYWSSASDLASEGRWHWFGSGAPVLHFRISGTGCATVTANRSLSAEDCRTGHYFVCNAFRSSEDTETTCL